MNNLAWIARLDGLFTVQPKVRFNSLLIFINNPVYSLESKIKDTPHMNKERREIDGLQGDHRQIC